MIAVAENRYGKSRVRLVQVRRKAGWHELSEWSVEMMLEGDFDSCFTAGDNSKILPTDTMKNMVYSLARDSAAGSMEQFAQEMVEFVMRGNPQVSGAELSISEKAWEHLPGAQGPHPTTFIQSSGELQTTRVRRNREGEVAVRSGLENLVIMKTSGSAFEGFLRDSLTTLQPAADRLLGTAAGASWNYARADLEFAALRRTVRDTLLAEFAGSQSRSVQHTLYAMGKAVLETVAEIDDIELTMPNKHCLLVDLSRFGQDNPNQIFVPVDEPHGSIQARVRRQG